LSHQNTVITRRSFCRHFAIGVVASFVGGKLLTRQVLADGDEEDAPGTFLINPTEYPELAEVHGSIVITLPGAPNALAPVVVTRGPNDVFYAVDSTCTHSQCAVNPYSIEDGVIECSCHGSRYEANGALVQGPAERSLRPFVATLIAPDQLRIVIPEFRFTTQATTIADPGRIRLQFPALAFLTYKVQFRATMQDAWSPVPFAIFDGGALDSTELLGNGSDVEIFVEAPQPTGFFSVITS
jgi:Rieske Fe-S protein